MLNTTMRTMSVAVVTAAFLGAVAARAAQQPPGGQGAPQPAPAGRGAAPPPQGPGGRGGQATFPAQQRQLADQAVLDRGKALWGINCASCHGVDARGGDQGGPNLLRSQLVLADMHGELILPIVQGARASQGMDPINLPAADVTAVAEYLHSLAAAGRARGSTAPLPVLVGDAASGQTAFSARCGSCHSATGDLKGIGTRIPDAMALQNFWVSGGGGGGRGGGGGGAAPVAINAKPTTVTVTAVSGQRTEGRLVRIDDFIVSLVDAEGNTRTFARDGDRPKVEVHDPLEPHRQLLPKYTDKEIHDITAYLAGVK